MKLHENKTVVKALENILAENFNYLQYDAAESKRRSNPKGEKRFKGQKDFDLLHVKVIDSNANRDYSHIYTIVERLERDTDIELSPTNTYVNVGILKNNEWRYFNIRRF